ncbi:MAG: FkbM family methyltransferase [Bacteroidia bacterium]
MLKQLIFTSLMPWLCRLLRIFWTPGPALRQRLKFHGPFSLNMKNGQKLRIWNQGFFLENELFWLGEKDFDWEKTSREIWGEACENADVILDIGANTGLYSLFAKAANPAATVFAFEPQPNIFSFLQKQNQLNGFDIQCRQLALSNQQGELPFYNYGDDAFDTNNTTAGSLNPDWRSENQQQIMVPVTRLADFLDQENIAKVDLIKIDVETLEPEVLEGYGELLKIHRPNMLIEIQSEEIGARVARLLEGADYQLFKIKEGEGKEAVDSLGGDAKHHNYWLMAR